MAELLDLVGAAFNSETERRNIALTIEVDHELALDADRELVISAVSNLVQNAVKYTPDGGYVRVRAFRTIDRVIVEVEDACGGLPPGKAEELFRPFVRRTAKPGGAGLGLSIVKRAASAMNGEVRVRDLPGRGCVFTLDLPGAVVEQVFATA